MKKSRCFSSKLIKMLFGKDIAVLTKVLRDDIIFVQYYIIIMK